MNNDKTIEIIAPEGYEIDKERSSFEKIVFRALPEKGLPRTWEELETVSGFVVSLASDIQEASYSAIGHSKNTWPSKAEAEASIALAQLCQLRDRYNGQTGMRDCPAAISAHSASTDEDHVNYLFCFKTYKLADEFEENFADLIEKAKPLLG